jgi:hypothetical protein
VSTALTHAALLPQAWIQCISKPVAQEVEGQHGDGDSQTGEYGDPWRQLHILAAAAEHHAPGGSGGLCAKPQEAEAGFGQDR